jgi:hypothetical protein
MDAEVGRKEHTVYDRAIWRRLTWCGDIMNDFVRFLEFGISKR